MARRRRALGVEDRCPPVEGHTQHSGQLEGILEADTTGEDIPEADRPGPDSLEAADTIPDSGNIVVEDRDTDVGLAAVEYAAERTPDEVRACLARREPQQSECLRWAMAGRQMQRELALEFARAFYRRLVNGALDEQLRKA